MVVSTVVDATTLASPGLVLELLFFVIRYYSLKVYLSSKVLKSSFYHYSRMLSTKCQYFLQCEKEFHVGCLKEHNMENLKVSPLHHLSLQISISFDW